ncbi:MAG: 3-deoxy-7-phosphoheptulonate synthase [Acidimicrobiales bacterium]
MATDSKETLAPRERSPIRNRRIESISPLVSPEAILTQLPLDEGLENLVLFGRESIAAIIDGFDDRLCVIVGPCSVHDPVAALEYAGRLRKLADSLREQLFVVMRVYFEKARTSFGWRGLINDPGLDGTNRVNDGIVAARRLLVDILALGVPIACEFLDPITPPYVADAVSWAAIGARTTQSPIHRNMASGLSMPVGFKNPTDGHVQSAVESVAVAARPQVFAAITDDGRPAVIRTRGNPDGHVVLRGTSSGPNFDEANVADTLGRLRHHGLPPRVIVDASHANSGKDHERQLANVADLARRIGKGERGIVGVMLESFLVAGRQELLLGHADNLLYGQSITDSCLSWEMTVGALQSLAEAITTRRTRAQSRSQPPATAGTMESV